MKTSIVYSKRMAYRLRREGLRIIKTLPNPKYPERDLYLFADTPLFREKFNQLLQEFQTKEEE